MRLLLVTAYNIACWVECYERRSFKSVRQVCSETFEVADPKKGYKMLAEDVSHCLPTAFVHQPHPVSG